jgi:hypothetical protein
MPTRIVVRASCGSGAASTPFPALGAAPPFAVPPKLRRTKP